MAAAEASWATRPLEAEALAVRTVVQFLSGQGLASQDLARALALEDPRGPRCCCSGPVLFPPWSSCGPGRASKAAAASTTCEPRRWNSAAKATSPLMYLYRVWAHLWSGDMARALEEASEARQTARRLDDRAASALALSAGALAAAYAGNEAAGAG